MASPTTHTPAIVRIVEASYGPVPGRRLLDGSRCTEADPSTWLPYTRDVTPHLIGLLGGGGGAKDGKGEEGEEKATAKAATKAAAAAGRRRRRAAVVPLDLGGSMNAAFGDPCPGTTKRLRVRFEFLDELLYGAAPPPRTCWASFAEHERVELRRPRREAIPYPRDLPEVPDADADADAAAAASSSSSSSSGPGTLAFSAPARTETVLSLLLPYLEVRERALCQLVCPSWGRVVLERGIASSVDFSGGDPALRNRRPYLRGLLATSGRSLLSLVLSDFPSLSRDDLHPALPGLLRLRALDVSRCTALDDSTLGLVARHLGGTLRTLYLKGLTGVTDAGIVAVCQSCLDLRTLEVSAVPLTDRSGRAIGTHLGRLEDLYMRDNHLLTARGVDAIAAGCGRLAQLTLWGLPRLDRLAFPGGGGGAAGGGFCSSACRIVLLNLWGCHGLTDGAAAAVGRMPELRSLIASECHRLTDRFVGEVARTSPRLLHLHLRYCRRVTGIGAGAVAVGLPGLLTLDLSFCTRVPLPAIAALLEAAPSLTELRLLNCGQLGLGSPGPEEARPDRDSPSSSGRALLAAVRGRGPAMGRLRILDVRGCSGRHRDRPAAPGRPDGALVAGMVDLGFWHELDGFFVRPALGGKEREAEDG